MSILEIFHQSPRYADPAQRPLAQWPSDKLSTPALVGLHLLEVQGKVEIYQARFIGWQVFDEHTIGAPHAVNGRMPLAQWGAWWDRLPLQQRIVYLGQADAFDAFKLLYDGGRLTATIVDGDLRIVDPNVRDGAMLTPEWSQWWDELSNAQQLTYLRGLLD